MPEVAFRVRWPDGSVEDCSSPSRVIEQALTPGASYPLDEFVRRARGALARSSERVREERGFACTAAAAQTADIERTAARMGGSSGARVTVEAMERIVVEPPPAPEVSGHHSVVVVGGGQAGLAMSHRLGARDIEHLVLERDRIAHTWRDARWDSFCLVTPNWQCRLPDFPYAGDDPDGFMVKEDILAYVEGFAASFGPPVVEGVAVTKVRPREEQDGFEVSTTAGDLTADQVVLAVGGYHVPIVPRLAERLPDHVTQVHSSGYRNAEALPDGAVLVVGTGQSGAQIAEDLHLAGRQVHLCVGGAPRTARFYRGRDVVAWLEDIGHYDVSVQEHPEGERQARAEPNHYVTGRDGGRDIDLRSFALDGMRLYGRLDAVRGTELAFAPDLRRNLDAADAVADRIKTTIDEYIASRGIDAPEEPRYSPVWEPDDEPGALDLEDAGVSTVIWSTGFRQDWSWVEAPAFDGTAYPVHERGVTTVPGLHVLGLPWLHTWGSGRFSSVARDAEHLAGAIAANRRRRGARATPAALHAVG